MRPTRHPPLLPCAQANNGTDGHAVTVTPCADECYVDPLIAAHVSVGARAAAALLRDRCGADTPPVPWQADLAAFAAEGTPFAYFAGFKRPHLGFQVPAWAFNLYPADVPIAAHRAPPPGYPPAGWWRNGEPDNLPDVKPWVEPNKTFPGMLRDPEHAPLRRGYYAAVSLMDAQLGKVGARCRAALSRPRASTPPPSCRSLTPWTRRACATRRGSSSWETTAGALASTVRRSTRQGRAVGHTLPHFFAPPLHSGNWAKQQLFEASLRVPFIIAPPSAPPGGDRWLRNVTVGPADAFVEMLDLFPTVAELFGVEDLVPPGQLQGRSLVPLLQSGAATAGDASVPSNFSAAFSQIVRSDRPCTPPSAALTLRAVAEGDSDPPQVVRGSGVAAPDPPCAMGLSVRVPGWRYTAWVGFSYGSDPGSPANSTVGPDWSDLRGEELYDHRVDDAPGPSGGGDPGNDFDLSELVNVAGQPSYAAQQSALRTLLEGQFPVTTTVL